MKIIYDKTNLIKYFLIIILSLQGCNDNSRPKIFLGSFTINTSSYNRNNTPISFECQLTDLLHANTIVPDSLDNYYFILEEQDRKNQSIPAQWIERPVFGWEQNSPGGELIWILKGKTKKNTIRNFNLFLQKSEPPGSPFSVTDIDHKSLLITKESKPVLQYNYGTMHVKEGDTDSYDRSSYIHPVWTYTGKIITGLINRAKKAHQRS